MTGDAFEALLAPNLPSARRFIQSRLRISDRVDDVIQLTLLQALGRRNRLHTGSKFKNWRCAIAMNQVRMFVRTGRPTISLDEFPQIDSRDGGPPPLARRLRDSDGLSLTETAEAFELSKAAKKSSHFQARRRREVRTSRVDQ